MFLIERKKLQNSNNCWINLCLIPQWNLHKPTGAKSMAKMIKQRKARNTLAIMRMLSRTNHQHKKRMAKRKKQKLKKQLKQQSKK